MPVYFFRPENALKRAKEFILVKKPDSALDILSDIIRSKKHRQWSEIHQAIIELYLELCIDLQKSPAAKDGLYQYRNICKDTNLNSFQVVINDFLGKVEEKAAEARKVSEKTVLDIEDLDMMHTPESLLLSTVSGEDTQDRTDRIVLTPWVKFLWESFRNILELLKNNTLMETIYTSVAKRAFGFCLEYKRRTEFHKLCDILRTHLRNAQEHQHAQNCLKFDSQETIQCLVEVRFEQLDKAISIDLWQEAFRAIEDIHSLISGPKHKAKASLLENFYQKQSSVYWMANNKLFHAAALYRLFVLRKEQKKTFSMESEDAKRTATHVLLATLAVPIQPIPSEIDRFLIVDTNTQGKSRRLADLLRMQVPPTRAFLLQELSRHGILQCVSPQLQQLYSLLEADFSPLVLCAKVSPLLDELAANETTKQYVESLKEVTLVRLIKQVSQIYQSIQLTRLCELAKFSDPVQMERLVVETAKTNSIPVKIDHNTDSFWFGADLSLSQHSKAPEGPTAQALPSELFCDHISVMAQALQQAAKLIFHKEMETELNKKYHKTVVKYRETDVASHKAILRRRKAIEDRKEYLEGIQREKEHQEKMKQKEEEREIKKKKKEKLDEELKEEQDKKKKKEMAELERRMAEDKLEALKKTPIGAKVFNDLTAEELNSLDPKMILEKQLLQMGKEKKDKEQKLKGQEKKIDHFERAKRLAEIPKRKKEYKEQIEADKKFHKKNEEEKINTAIKEREEAEMLKKRLGIMEDSKKEFMKIIKKQRNVIYQEKLNVFEAKLNEERVKRLEQRKADRKKRRMTEAVAMKKAEEEKQARLKVEAEKRQKEEERKAHIEKMEQQRLKQMQREQEIEEKQQKREEERMREMRMTREEQDDRSSWRPVSSPAQQKKDSYRPPQQRTEDTGSWRSSEPDRRDNGPWDRDRTDGGGSPWSSGRGWRDDRRPEQDRYQSRDQDRYRDNDRFDRRSEQDRYPPRDRDNRFDQRPEQDRYPSRDQDRFSNRPSNRYGDSDRYRDRGDRDFDRFRGNRDTDRFRGDGDSRGDDHFRRDSDRPYRGGDRFGERKEDNSWRQSPDRRGFDRSPRRDEGRDKPWRTEERRREMSPPRQRDTDTSPRSRYGEDRPSQRRPGGTGGGQEETEGWERVTRKR